MTSDAVLRQVRVLTLPSVLFFSGLAGHAAADGVMPGTSVLIPLFVLTVVLVAQFGGAPRTSPARAVVLLAGGQGLSHAALQMLGGTAVPATTTICDAASHTATMPSPTSSHMMMHQHCAAAAHGSALSGMSGGHVAMLLGHLAAAVAVGAWLVAGERAFWTLLALTARPVVEAWRTVTKVLRVGVGAVVADCQRLQLGWGLPYVFRDSIWAAGVVPRRGPPVKASPRPHTCAAVATV
jgi:hypothetical protein